MVGNKEKDDSSSPEISNIITFTLTTSIIKNYTKKKQSVLKLSKIWC